MGKVKVNRSKIILECNREIDRHSRRRCDKKIVIQPSYDNNIVFIDSKLE